MWIRGGGGAFLPTPPQACRAVPLPGDAPLIKSIAFPSTCWPKRGQLCSMLGAEEVGGFYRWSKPGRKVVFCSIRTLPSLPSLPPRLGRGEATSCFIGLQWARPAGFSGFLGPNSSGQGLSSLIPLHPGFHIRSEPSWRSVHP